MSTSFQIDLQPKLYIPSTIKTEINLVLLMFLNRLGYQGSTLIFFFFAILIKDPVFEDGFFRF